MEKRRPKPLLAGALATVWLLIVIVAYAATHKPFEEGFLRAVAAGLWRLLLALWIVAAGGGLGKRLLPLEENSWPPALRAVAQAAIGLGMLAILILALGSVLGLSWYVLAVLLLSMTLLLRRHLVGWLYAILIHKGAWQQTGLFEKLLAAATMFILIASLLTALAPPLKFDALVYHLALPQAYLQAGRIAYLAENIFWGMPQTMEMLYTLAMALGGVEAATAVGWAVGLLTLAGIGAYAAHHFGRQAGWVAASVLLCGWSLANSLHWAYNEWPLMLYGLVFLIGLEEWAAHARPRLLALAGLGAGFALGTKYTGGILAGIGLILIAWQHLSKRKGGWLKDLLVFSSLLAAVTLPWWIKNAVATGNPFYPLLFPAGEMSRFRLALYTGGEPWGGWVEMLTLPWQATVLGVEQKVGPSASIGPLLLGLSPLAAIGWKEQKAGKRRALGLAAAVTGIGFLTWALASRSSTLLIQTRLYVAFFPAWAFLSAAGFAAVSALHAGQVRFGRLAGAFVALSLVFTALEMGNDLIARRAVAAVTGQISRQEYLERNLGDYAGIMETIRNLPPGSRVLMLWETRSLYCLPRCDPDEVIDSWRDALHRHPDIEEILQSWREENYTHILLNRAGMEFVRSHEKGIAPQSWALLDSLQNRLPLLETSSNYLLYRIEPP